MARDNPFLHIISMRHIAFIIIFLFVLTISALAFLDGAPIAWGVSIGPISIGGKDPATALAMLKKETRRYLETPFIVTVNGARIQATPAEWGMIVDTQKTMENARLMGKKGAFFNRAATHITSLFMGIRIKPAARIEHAAFDAFFQTHLLLHEKKTRQAAMLYDEKKELFTMRPEQEGLVVNASALKYELLRSAEWFDSRDISALMAKDEPFLRKEMIEPVKNAANEILKQAPFTLLLAQEKNTGRSSDAARARIEKNQFGDFLEARRAGDGARLDVNENELRNFLIGLAPMINKKPRNAVLTVKEGRVAEFAISQNGIELDADASIASVKEGILGGKKSAEIVVRAIYPEVRTETIENLGIVALLGTGESDFTGSSAARVFNVKLGAKKLNGTLIKQGEEFSFVNAIGEIDSKEGWQAGLVIKGNALVPEYGGGICQVSTTMFRAAIYSGLPITERFSHSLPVQYYNPQGFDATVYGPHPDFRFVNDTPSAILVQTEVKGTKLFFEFYGTPDGREVKLEKPVEYDKKPDGSLKAMFSREIFKEGIAVKKDVFRSVYRSPKKEAPQRNPLE